MNRSWAIVAGAIVAVLLLVGAGYYYIVMTDKNDTIGFSSQDLVTPWASLADDIDNSLPNGTTPTPISADDVNLYWNITEDIYEGYGGALTLRVQNKNHGTLYVYSFGLKWVDSGDSYFRNCSVTISSQETKELGLLLFGAPSAGREDYQIVIKAAISNLHGTLWYDAGSLPSGSNSVTVSDLAPPLTPEVSYNVLEYYNRINERVDLSAVSVPVSIIRAAQPGNYSVLQIAEAFSWMRKNVAYVTESSGDYWQTAEETLTSQKGDCEDHAILLSSIIGALGGNARVNLIDEHAFPTVFLASTYEGLMKAKASLASYYGVEASSFKMAYLVDSNGYWLVVDPTGFPYAGGLPANSKPTSASGTWTPISDYLICVDATGHTFSRGIFGLL